MHGSPSSTSGILGLQVYTTVAAFYLSKFFPSVQSGNDNSIPTLLAAVPGNVSCPRGGLSTSTTALIREMVKCGIRNGDYCWIVLSSRTF